MPIEPKITDTQTVTFPETGESVTVEVSNTEKSFCWRLSIGKYNTGWTKYYEGILVIASRHYPNVKYGYATDYWRGTLPVEEIFMIVRREVF